MDAMTNQRCPSCAGVRLEEHFGLNGPYFNGRDDGTSLDEVLTQEAKDAWSRAERLFADLRDMGLMTADEETEARLFLVEHA